MKLSLVGQGLTEEKANGGIQVRISDSSCVRSTAWIPGQNHDVLIQVYRTGNPQYFRSPTTIIL